MRNEHSDSMTGVAYLFKSGLLSLIYSISGRTFSTQFVRYWSSFSNWERKRHLIREHSVREVCLQLEDVIQVQSLT